MNWSSLNWLDAVCLGLALWFGLFGLWIGLVRSLFNLAALTTAALSAWFFAGPLAIEIKKLFSLESHALTQFISAILLFISIYLGIRWLGKRLHKFLHDAELGFYNRLAGLLFGLAKAALLSILLMALIQLIPPEFIEPHRQRSIAYQLYLWANPPGWIQEFQATSQKPPQNPSF